MKKIIKEFQDFALRGNMIDLAVGVIIGGAFNSLVTSLVNNVLMPVLGLFVGKLDFSNLFIALDGNQYASLQAARDASAPIFAYGQFLTEVLNFLIMAFVIFMIVRQINAHNKKTAAPAKAPHEKVCPFCKTTIDLDATRCPHCTSLLTDAAEEKTL